MTRARVHRRGADKTERLRVTRRPSGFIGFLLLATMLTPVSAADPAAPVRDVVDSHFGVTVHDPYRYFENLADPEVAAWIKAQAHATRDGARPRAASPGALRGDRQVRRCGFSSRHVAAASPRAAPIILKRNADENIPKLYVRDGFGGKERLLVDPDPCLRRRHAQCNRLFPAVAGQQVPRLRDPLRRLRTKRPPYHRRRHRNKTGDVINRANRASSSLPPATDSSTAACKNSRMTHR